MSETNSPTASVAPTAPKGKKPVPARFLVSPLTLWIDFLMTWIIKIGGIGVIVAVIGIMVFITWQVFPLFMSATVKPESHVKIAMANPALVGIDEWGELPFAYDGNNTVEFYDAHGKNPPLTVKIALPEGEKVTATRYFADKGTIVIATDKGNIADIKIRFDAKFDDKNHRTITGQAELSALTPLLELPAATTTPATPVAPAPAADPAATAAATPAPALVPSVITTIDRGAGDNGALIGAIVKIGDKRELRAITFKQKRSMRGGGTLVLDQRIDLTSQLRSAPAHLLVPTSADALIVATDSGEVSYFFRDGDKFELRQTFQPFADTPGTKGIARMDFIFGDVSIVFSGQGGQSRVFSLCKLDDNSPRMFYQTKNFPSLVGPASFFASSQRNKAFLTGSGTEASLRYSTTETIRWQENLGFVVKQGIIGAKYENLAFLDTANTLHVYKLHDPHPEAGFRAFFGKLWYEGLPSAEYAYQSSGGSDDFEPKLSLIPLIWGSIKGTFCALIFAVPIALMAAIYTSQFLDPSLKRIVKPTMEIMASLPSVVLGFLAALWLAPRVADRVPSLLLILIMLVCAPMLFSLIWMRIPKIYRLWLRPGWEWMLMMPLFFIICIIGWKLGPVLEHFAFVYTEPGTGKKIADFGLWWKQTTGGSYDQRNSMVVGFMMGFAVIPIIFTIAEDSLSNVPAGLRSASLALGATRWQTAWEVVLPIASAGIFSALMIGFGRAVGETMIVVMATGNTPVMDFNLFSGMRTLSANIAVELPEAPQFSTHFRVLFLGALLLFMLTFVINTLAEVLRNHLREKYKGI